MLRRYRKAYEKKHSEEVSERACKAPKGSKPKAKNVTPATVPVPEVDGKKHLAAAAEVAGPLAKYLSATQDLTV